MRSRGITRRASSQPQEAASCHWIAFAFTLAACGPATMLTAGLRARLSIERQDAGADVLERRGTEPTILGDIVSVDDAGVTISSQFGAKHFVPWDRVRRIDDDKPSSDLAARMSVAEDLWRARSRVERHDTSLAEPLLHRLFYERYLGKTSETALVVAEGLLRCLLARQEHALAIVPALEVTRLRRANIRTESYSRLAAIHDGATALCPDLAPAWLPGRSVERLQRELANYDARGDQVVAALAALYRTAAMQAAGQPADVPALATFAAHPGVALLHQMVECAPGRGQASVDAVHRLSARMTELPQWAQAWARYRLGITMLAAEDRATQDSGFVQLMHVPAAHGRLQPFLAGLALSSAAEAMTRRGDLDAANSLRTELASAFPDHPARIGAATP